jgi:hypothetical protein
VASSFTSRRWPESVAWIVSVEPMVWTVDGPSSFSDPEIQDVRTTVRSWEITGPPVDGVTDQVGSNLVHEYEMESGAIIKFMVKDDGSGGGTVTVVELAYRS